jgi:hypothetical protein
MKNPRLSALQEELGSLANKVETLETFQDATNLIKEEFPNTSNYIRRYSYVGPKVQRTKLYGTDVSRSTFYRMKNAVETEFPWLRVEQRENNYGLQSIVIYND